MLNAYEQGGVAGPNAQEQLIAALKGQKAVGVPGMTPGVDPSVPAAPLGPVDAPDLSGFDRRGGGTGGILGGAASGALTGAALGTHGMPGWGTAIGAGAGAIYGGIKGAVTKHASTAPTDFNVADARTAIGQEYQHDLGRSASPQELDAQLAGQGWKPGSRYVGDAGLKSVLGSIGQSPEAQAFAARGSQPTAQTAVADALAPPAAAGKQYALEGFDAGKLADTTHTSPKYQLGRALQGFDPNQGVTPDVLAALNKLGIGQFSGNGGHLAVANGDPRFDGMNAWDSVRGLNSGGHAAWQYGVDSNLDTPQRGTGQAGGINPMLGGDPTASIQAALGKLGTQPDLIKQLIASLQGGV